MDAYVVAYFRCIALKYRRHICGRGRFNEDLRTVSLASGYEVGTAYLLLAVQALKKLLLLPRLHDLSQEVVRRHEDHHAAGNHPSEVQQHLPEVERL